MHKTKEGKKTIVDTIEKNMKNKKITQNTKITKITKNTKNTKNTRKMNKMKNTFKTDIKVNAIARNRALFFFKLLFKHFLFT